jgi:hypothetical protein
MFSNITENSINVVFVITAIHSTYSNYFRFIGWSLMQKQNNESWDKIPKNKRTRKSVGGGVLRKINVPLN